MPDETSLPIHGFGATGYRTFADARVETGRLTVVTGPNNSGKSSLLALLDHYSAAVSAVTRPGSSPVIPDIASYLVRIDPRQVPVVDAAMEQTVGMDEDFARGTIIDVLAHLGPLWVAIERDRRGDWTVGQDPRAPLSRVFDDHLRAVRGARKRVLARAFLLEDEPVAGYRWLRSIVRLTVGQPTIRSISDIRRAPDRPLSDADLWTLTQAASPDTTGSRIERWTVTIEAILRDTFGDDVRYVVQPREHSGNFYLAIDGQENVPLDHVGAGVREAVALAFQAVRGDKATVLAIEEPENCLHPAAARRLLRSLLVHTEAQIVVSTHAAGIVNAAPDRLVFVERSPEGSVVTNVVGDDGRYAAVRALGYQPSDLVLTPCAVWVEGPSDREYLRRWLQGHGLEDGIDYHIMFTGGALATHLTTEAEPLADDILVAIRMFSRRCIVLADSDRAHEGAPLKAHVARFETELAQDAHGLCVVTRGREIENYLEPDAVDAVRAQRAEPALDRSDLLWRRVIPSGSKLTKLDFARRYLALTEGVPELAQAQVAEIAEFIRRSPEVD